MTFAQILALLTDAPPSLLMKVPQILALARVFPRGEKPSYAEYVAFVEAAKPLLCALTPEEFAFLKKAVERF